MNQSNTHRKPILLYCSRPTQTYDDDSESNASDFPPCRVGNSPPLISRSPALIPTHSRYLRAAAQTHYDSDSKSDDSDFPPCRVGNSEPFISRSSAAPVPTHSRYLREPAVNRSQRLTTSSENEPLAHQLQRRGQRKGLGQMNVINTVDATLKVFIYFLVYIVAVLIVNVNIRLIVLFTENVC